MVKVEEAFSKMSLRESSETPTEKRPDSSPRMCSIYLRGVINFLSRETCGGLRLVSGRLDDELSVCSRLPKKVLQSVAITATVSPAGGAGTQW